MDGDEKDGGQLGVHVSEQEAACIWLMRLNAATPVLKIDRSFQIWNLRFRFSWRSAKNLWGRFGGGWNWKLGFTAGSTTVVVHLLIAEVSVSYVKPKPAGT